MNYLIILFLSLSLAGPSLAYGKYTDYMGKQTSSFLRGSGNEVAVGVNLVFLRWPSEDEEEIIIDKMETLGLRPFDRIKVLNMWIFNWSKTEGFYTASEAEEVCKTCSASFSLDLDLDYCEPNVLNMMMPFLK